MSDSRIIERAFRAQFTNRFRIEEALTSLATSVLGMDPIAAGNYAKRRQRKLWNQITERIDEENRKGLHPTFRVLDVSTLELAWFAARESSDPADVQMKKAKLALRGQVLDEIDNLNSRDYEALGCLVCKEAGASKWFLTPPGNDKGIDFLALVPAVGSAHIFPSLSNEIRIVGQSKKWTSSVPREKIDLLATTVEGIRRRSERIIPTLPSWFVSSEGPLVGCMIGHTGLQGGAWDIARDEGIIAADSRDVAEIICLSNSWDTHLGISGLKTWMRETLNDILDPPAHVPPAPTAP